MSYIKLSDAKKAIINCIGEQTVSKYATSAECKAARHGADLALFSLDDIPTADVVEVRHGRWLSAYEYSLRFDISEERRNEVKNDRIWKFCCLCEQSAKWDYDYCPNCGAKMDGERSENGKS